MTTSNSEQQYFSCSNSRIATHRAGAAEIRGRYKKIRVILVRFTAAYSSIKIQ